VQTWEQVNEDGADFNAVQESEIQAAMPADVLDIVREKRRFGGF